jgi:hypothetical protein
MSRLASVLLFSLSLLLALSLGFVKAEPVQAQEGAGITLVKFEGVINARPAEKAGIWTIGEQDIAVTETTILVETEGEAVVGAQAMVIAKRLAEDEFEAILIRVKPGEDARIVYLAGVVESYTEDVELVVNGKTIQITVDTQIEGEIEEDAHVLVKARFDGTEYEAIKIQVVDMLMQRMVEFDGVVESISEDLWEIAGYEVGINVDPYRTMIMGQIKVGDRVQVRAVKLQDDSLVALLIRKAGAAWWPKVQEFTAAIVSFPEEPPYVGEWVIGERTVLVKLGIPIVGTPEVGLQAHVTAWHFPDGNWVAMKIEIEEQDPTADEITFTGEIQRFPMTLWGMWMVGDRRVLVLPGTDIEGMPQVGATATVTGTVKGNDVVVAKEISIEGEGEPVEGDIHFVGLIREVGNGHIKVGAFGVTTWQVNITARTKMEGTPAVGKGVAVHGLMTGPNECEGLLVTVVDLQGDDSGKIRRTVD